MTRIYKMIFSQTIENINSEITALLSQVEAKKQQQNQLMELDALTDSTLRDLADVVSKIQYSAPNAICALLLTHYAPQTQQCNALASLKTAVLTLFEDAEDGNDGGNQPTDPTPDTDPTPRADNSEPELFCFNGETREYLLTDGTTSVEDETPPLTYTQAIKNRCSACWGYKVATKRDIKEGFVNRTNLNFMEAVNLERNGKDFYQTVEAYLDRLYYNSQSCPLEDCPETSLVGQYKKLTSPLASLLWEDAPLLGQHCAVTFEVSAVSVSVRLNFDKLSCPAHAEIRTDNENKGTTDGEAIPFVELIKVSDAIAYQLKRDGEVVCCYVGFRNKSIATSWMRFIEAITDRVELRQALRMQGFKWEMKIKGMSIQQIERLSKEDIDKTYRPEIGSAKPPSYKPQRIAQPVNPEEAEPGDIVTALLTPSASYKIIQVMPNGILDCENLTTGYRLGLRATAVTLVQKGEKPEQQALLLDPKPDTPKKYARVEPPSA